MMRKQRILANMYQFRRCFIRANKEEWKSLVLLTVLQTSFFLLSALYVYFQALAKVIDKQIAAQSMQTLQITDASYTKDTVFFSVMLTALLIMTASLGIFLLVRFYTSYKMMKHIRKEENHLKKLFGVSATERINDFLREELVLYLEAIIIGVGLAQGILTQLMLQLNQLLPYQLSADEQVNNHKKLFLCALFSTGSLVLAKTVLLAKEVKNSQRNDD